MRARIERWMPWALVLAVAVGCGGGGSGGGGGGGGGSGTLIRLDAGGCLSGYATIVRDGAQLEYDYFTSGAGTGQVGSCPDTAFPGCGLLPPSLPPALGQAWTSTGTSNGYRVDSSVALTSVTETVTVPDGTFTGCAKYVNTLSYPDGYTPGQPRDVTCTVWLAPGVGPVKYALVVEDPIWSVESQLVAHSTPAAGDDYLPLAVGNSWSFKTTRSYSGVSTWTVTSVTP